MMGGPTKVDENLIFQLRCGGSQFIPVMTKFMEFSRLSINKPTLFLLEDPTVGSVISYEVVQQVFDSVTVFYQHRWILRPIKDSDLSEIDSLCRAFNRTCLTYENSSMYGSWSDTADVFCEFRPKRRPTFDPVFVMRNAVDEVRKL